MKNIFIFIKRILLHATNIITFASLNQNTLLMKKIMFVLFLIFIVRLFVSCCRCSDETTPMQLNEITIKNLCTAGDYGDVIYNETDAMSSSKVAFKVIVADSTIDTYIEYYACNNANWGFSAASATSCDCYQLFKPEQQIVDIRIFSLLKMSEQIAANTDVTKYFVAIPSASQLYTPIDKLYPLINRDVIIGGPTIDMSFFCKLNIENTKAQFVVNIELSDGRMLSAFTNELQLTATGVNEKSHL